MTNMISVELWEINHVYDDTYIWSEIVVALIVHLTRYSMSLCISETLQAMNSEAINGSQLYEVPFIKEAFYNKCVAVLAIIGQN